MCGVTPRLRSRVQDCAKEWSVERPEVVERLRRKGNSISGARPHNLGTQLRASSRGDNGWGRSACTREAHPEESEGGGEAPRRGDEPPP